MNYKKISSMILNKFFKNEKILYQHVDGGSLICLDNILIVNIPDVYNIFNVGMFEPANLMKIIDSVKDSYESGYFTGRMMGWYTENKPLYEIKTTSDRLFYIDSKVFNPLGIDNPVFYASLKTDHGVLLVEDACANYTQICAAICPVNI